MQVTISIVNWNTKEFLRKCLNSIYENNFTSTFEIYVVDNASSDGSVKMIEEEFPLVKIIANSSNVGYGTANNQVMRLTKSKYFLLLNSDVEMCANSLDKMVEFMDLHPEAAVIGCKLLNTDGSLQPSLNHTFPGLWFLFSELFMFSAIKMRLYKNKIYKRFVINRLYHSHNRPQEIAWAGGSSLMVRLNVIKKVGIMDENYFLYKEEVDWCRRIKKSGWKIFYIPDAKVIHHWSKSSDQSPENVFLAIQKSTLYYYKKFYGNLGLLFARFVIVFGILEKICINLPGYLLGWKKNKQKLETLLTSLKIVVLENVP